MNKNSDSPSAPAPRSVLFATGIVFLLAVVFLWREQARTKDRLGELVNEKTHIEQKLDTTAQSLAEARRKLADADKELDILKSRSPFTSTKRTATAVTPPKEEIETLFLQEPTVAPIPEGLLVKLEYRPEAAANLPDSTTLVFRVPGSGMARILALNATGSSDRAIINADGTLAMIECSLAERGALAFELKVSGPATALVRGSEGIIDIELSISNDSCSVRPLN